LDQLGPGVTPLREDATQLRSQLEESQQQFDDLTSQVGAEDGPPLKEQLRLSTILADVERLQMALRRLTTLPPEVVISPLALETQNLARLEPDLVTFYAPSIVALLVQHAAVSMGALALVRERLAGTFDLYAVAPINVLHLLLGKYLAYLIFTLIIAIVVLAVLLGGMGVPLLGSPWRLVLTVVALTFASVGLGFALSLLASSEQQAVQLAMLLLLGVVFFSGFTLPLDALRQPAIGIAYALPATYGIHLLRDVMLRGTADGPPLLTILTLIALAMFAICLGLLWRRSQVR
jgi:ABC-2 type transport system permease protein